MPIMCENSKIKLLSADGIKKIYCQNTVIYSTGNIVTYVTGNGTYKEEVEEGASCLSPKTFTPALSGWTFIGWRTDTAANGSVLGSLTMGEAPVTLYAVFRQTITLSYNGNGATSGSTANQTGYRYYNNGSVANPGFTVKANGFARSGYIWTGWASGTTAYAVGQSVTLSSNLTLTAQWYTAAATNFSYNGGIQSWTVPITGLYLLKAYGAAGGYGQNWLGNVEYRRAGGKGGYAYRYVQLTAGQTIYIVCGGKGADKPISYTSGGGYNGGGNPGSPGGNSYVGYPGAGGGATHIATRSGTLKALGSVSGVLLVAGGAGGGGAHSETSSNPYGGDGGGLSGNPGGIVYGHSYGGTQSSGGNTGGTDSKGNGYPGFFGQGGGGEKEGKPGVQYAGGGGGGLYGGGCGGQSSGGGGGSSYIGSNTTTFKGATYTNGTTAGQNSGNGYASVQFIAA